jgi:hypothetical protein
VPNKKNIDHRAEDQDIPEKIDDSWLPLGLMAYTLNLIKFTN